MQRLRSKAKTTKDFFRKVQSSRDGRRSGRSGPWLLFACLVLLTGCADEEQTAARVPEQVEPAADVDVYSDTDAGSFVSDDDRSVAQRIEDASLAAAVRLALADVRELRAFQFDPVVVDGRVRVSGHVETIAQRRRAESIAASVEGIRTVVSAVTTSEAPSIAEMGSADALSRDPGTDDEASPGTSPSYLASGGSSPVAGEPETSYYTVRFGDTLWDIARHFGVSVDQIRRLNDLGAGPIKPGQRLQVK